MPAAALASLLALVPVLSSAHADPGHAPGLDDTVQISWDLSKFEAPAGQLLWVAVPQLRPCEKPMGACSAEPLKAGTPVIVVELGSTETPSRRPSRWVRVAQAVAPSAADEAAKAGAPLGWVLAHQLSGASWELDLDEDGEQERVVVRFADAPRMEAHVVEPSGAVATLDLEQAQDFEGPQTEGSARILAKASAGLPLVHVNWARREMCGSGDYSRYASYRSPGPGQAGTARIALWHGGSGSDAPVWYETKASFDGKGGVLVHHRSGEYLDSGEEGLENETKTTYALDPATGVFQKQKTEQLRSPEEPGAAG